MTHDCGCPRTRHILRRHRLGALPLPDFPDRLAARHEPTTIGVIVSIAAIASTALAVYGQYQASQQQQASLEYNAILARQQAAYAQQAAGVEAALMERQAQGITALAASEVALAEMQTQAQIQAAETAGAMRERQLTRSYDRTQSEVRAAVGKAGVDTTGSPLMVLLENADTAGEELAINDYRTALDVAGAKADLSIASASALTSAKLQSQSLMGEAAYRRFGGGLAAQGSLAQASLFGMQARGVRSGTMFGIGNTLLSGASAAASPWLRYGAAA